MRDLLLKAGLGLATAALARDAVSRPQQMARLARSSAERAGKPLANLGAGVRGKSLRASIFGERLWGDVNLDDRGPLTSPGPDVVSFCSYYTLPYEACHFGALFACDVLEHLEYPELALREWHRVAERVFVVVPAWWRPDKWTARWVLEPSMERAWPLWSRRNGIVVLPVSDTSRYARPRCQTPKQTSTDPSLPIGTTASSSSVSTMVVLSGLNTENT